MRLYMSSHYNGAWQKVKFQKMLAVNRQHSDG